MCLNLIFYYLWMSFVFLDMSQLKSNDAVNRDLDTLNLDIENSDSMSMLYAEDELLGDRQESSPQIKRN
jgi:hypothetical protein